MSYETRYSNTQRQRHKIISDSNISIETTIKINRTEKKKTRTTEKETKFNIEETAIATGENM